MQKKRPICNTALPTIGLGQPFRLFSDVAKPNQQYVPIHLATTHIGGFSYDDLAPTGQCRMDLPPYERIMWARANTGQRTPYCDL